MPIFLKWAAKESCPVLSPKFDTASFLVLPLYSAKVLWKSLHFFVTVSASASCLYFVAILWFKSFLIESACDGVSLVCNVVPFLASLSAIALPSSPTWEGAHWNMTIFFKTCRCLRVSFMLFISFDFGWLLEETAWIAAFHQLGWLIFQMPEVCTWAVEPGR